MANGCSGTLQCNCNASLKRKAYYVVIAAIEEVGERQWQMAIVLLEQSQTHVRQSVLLA